MDLEKYNFSKNPFEHPFIYAPPEAETDVFDDELPSRSTDSNFRIRPTKLHFYSIIIAILLFILGFACISIAMPRGRPEILSRNPEKRDDVTLHPSTTLPPEIAKPQKENYVKVLESTAIEIISAEDFQQIKSHHHTLRILGLHDEDLEYLSFALIDMTHILGIQIQTPVTYNGLQFLMRTFPTVQNLSLDFTSCCFRLTDPYTELLFKSVLHLTVSNLKSGNGPWSVLENLKLPRLRTFKLEHSDLTPENCGSLLRFLQSQRGSTLERVLSENCYECMECKLARQDFGTLRLEYSKSRKAPL